MAFCLAAIVGCGSGSSSSTDESGSTTASSGAGTESSDTTGSSGTAKPVGEPPQKESLQAAEKRIKTAIASGDCDKINELNPVSIPQLNTDERCDLLKRLLVGKPLDSESFKDLAAVIDYGNPNRVFSALLIRDIDGLYHVAFIDPFHESAAVGTPFAKQFEKSADTAFESLGSKDCDAYIGVVYRFSGVGASTDEADICPRVESNLIAAALERSPDAKPKLIGGDGFYAFYGLDTASSYLTLAFAKQSESELPANLSGERKLPAGAAKYAYLGAYRTNTPTKSK